MECHRCYKEFKSEKMAKRHADNMVCMTKKEIKFHYMLLLMEEKAKYEAIICNLKNIPVSEAVFVPTEEYFTSQNVRKKNL